MSNSGSVRTMDARSSCTGSLSLGVVLHIAHELPDVRLSCCERATWRHFARVYTCKWKHLNSKFHKDHLWAKLSTRIKEGFSFILFPLVCM